MLLYKIFYYLDFVIIIGEQVAGRVLLILLLYEITNQIFSQHLGADLSLSNTARHTFDFIRMFYFMGFDDDFTFAALTTTEVCGINKDYHMNAPP